MSIIDQLVALLENFITQLIEILLPLLELMGGSIDA